MKKTFLLLASVLCLSSLCYGTRLAMLHHADQQPRSFSRITDISRLPLNGDTQEHPEALDTARLVVTYRLDWQQDTTEYNMPRWDLIVFQVGEQHAKFYGELFYLHSLSVTKMLRGEEWTEEDKERYLSSGDGIIDYEIFTDLQKRKIISVHNVPFSLKHYEVAEYDEPLPKLTWTFSEQCRELLGYTCRLATTRFGGRTWQAWYTEEIPCLFGPWKLSGLPGLVLLLEDSQGHYRFACEEIRQQHEPIYYYRRPNTRRTTKKLWQKFMRMAHEAPAATFAADYDIYTNTAEGKRIKLDQSWTIPYNPIERE